MKTKLTILGFMLVMMIALVSASALAATTTLKIANGINSSDTAPIKGTITVGIEVNVSGLVAITDTGNTSNNVTRIELLYLASKTGASTIAHAENLSHAGNLTLVGGFSFGVWNISFDTSALNDSDGTYTFSARASNGTNGSYNILATSATHTGIVIDNTIPTSTIDNVAGSVFDAVTATATATVTNVPSSCIWNIAGNTLTGTINSAGDSCSLTLSKANPPDGDYDATVRVYDGTNTTTSAGVHFSVKFASDASRPDADLSVITEVVKQNAGNKNLIITLGLGLFVLLLWNGRKK